MQKNVSKVQEKSGAKFWKLEDQYSAHNNTAKEKKVEMRWIGVGEREMKIVRKRERERKRGNPLPPTLEKSSARTGD